MTNASIDLTASAEFVSRVPISFARRFALIGLASEDAEVIRVAVCDDGGLNRSDAVGRLLNRFVEPVDAPREAILKAIDHAYQQREGQSAELVDWLETDGGSSELASLVEREDLLDSIGGGGERAPVIKLVNLLLLDAVKGRASDVHIQPYEERLMVRMRIDGVLFDTLTIPKRMQDEVTSRVKVLGRMDIAERRLPQDGRATVRLGDRMVDLRIASLPTSHGERVVIRLLDKSARVYSLDELGMAPDVQRRFGQLVRQEHGLVLVTGPTGAGKSTTLYAGLLELDAKERNIVTLEDPIEYQLDGISQTQINEKKGMTFARGLRNVLRQDPDIIMVGEVRDQETAVMAIQSALTGHMVFSTLHTNDAASAVTRLLDLGIEPYLVSSSLVGVLAQRLVRRICADCRESYQADTAELARIDRKEHVGAEVSRGKGCESCRGTGYRGRLGLFELLVADEAIRAQIQARANASEVLAAATATGMQRLADDGWRKVLAAETTIDEVARVSSRGATEEGP